MGKWRRDRDGSEAPAEKRWSLDVLPRVIMYYVWVAPTETNHHQVHNRTLSGTMPAHCPGRKARPAGGWQERRRGRAGRAGKEGNMEPIWAAATSTTTIRWMQLYHTAHVTSPSPSPAQHSIAQHRKAHAGDEDGDASPSQRFLREGSMRGRV